MATWYTAQYNLEKTDRTANPTRLAPPNISSGEVQVALIPYTIDSTEAAGELLYICNLPIGSYVIPHLSSVYSADPGTTLTFDVGTSTNTDAYADGITLSAGGLINFTSGTAPSGLTPEAIVAPTGSLMGPLVGVFATTGTLTASVVLYICVAYKVGKG